MATVDRDGLCTGDRHVWLHPDDTDPDPVEFCTCGLCVWKTWAAPRVLESVQFALVLGRVPEARQTYQPPRC